jgi:diguanylate cyclase (GGDEF)-like protein
MRVVGLLRGVRAVLAASRWTARADGLTPDAERHRRGAQLWLVLAMVVAGLANAAATQGGAWQGPSLRLQDLRFHFGSRPSTGTVALVDIDEKSLRAIGIWPWPRTIHAAIVDKLVAGGAEAIAFDIDFSSRSTDAADAAFAAALERAGGGVILAALRQRLSAGDEGLSLTRPLPILEEHAWPALIDVHTDVDSLLRTVPSEGASDGVRLPSLSTSLAGMPGRASEIRIDYAIEAGSIDRISTIDLLEGRVAPQRLAGHKIIVGASAVSLKDFFSTPRYGALPGALVQAMAVESLLQGRDLARPAPWAAMAGLGLVVALGIAVTLLLPLPWAVTALLGAMAALEGAAVLVQIWLPLSLDTLPWHLALLACILLDVGYEVARRRLLLLAARTSRRRTQAILDRVFEDSVAGVVVVDDSGRIRAASRAAMATLDLSEADLSGRPAAEVLPAPLMSLLTDPRSADGSFQLATPRGIRIFQYTMSQSRSDGDAQAGIAWTATCITFNDVTDRVRDQENIERLARYDSLTGLPNRNHFMERLSQATDVNGACLLQIDLDGFKAVNDALGQNIGDQMLRAVVRRLNGIVSPKGFVARVDGDEFAILTDVADPQALADQVQHAFRQPFEAAGRRAVITASIGVAVGEDGIDGDELSRRAVLALSCVKDWGGKTASIYSRELDLELRAKEELDRELAHAVERGEFRVFYQVQEDCRSRDIAGAEALVRWQHPEKGLIPPGMFIPALERTGLIVDVGAFVLKQACRDAATWSRPLRIAVNVAVPQLMRGDFSVTLKEALAETGLAPERLDIELTESLFLQDERVVLQELSSVRSLGVGLALDDFGTGYSALGYIKRLPFTKVKLDRSFVKDLPDGRESVAIIQAVVAMATALDMKVVAEGVERPEQWQAVQLLGCNEMQGYLLGRPEDAEAFARRIEAAAGRRSA